jgi:enoyl-CoA hydratase/carnithine racemase
VSDGDILTERRGRVLWITFNRPQARNAMKLAMYERLVALCDAIDADEGLRAVVLTGAGERAFVSGTDISEFEVFSQPDDALAYERRMGGAIDRLEAVRVPLIAAVRGACTGAGMAIAAACDLRIATPGARFGFPVARTLGNCLSIPNYARLVDTVGATAVKEMVYLAALIDARRAYELRFLNEVLQTEDGLLERAGEIAEAIAGNAPLTIRATKEALRRIARDGRGADDRDLIVSCYMSNDFREGMTAFFEKRPANWTGH